MQAQGSSPFNQVYFDQLIVRINGVTDCHDLQAIVAEAFASVQAQLDGINTQLANIAPMLALIKPPTNLLTLITWVTKFISLFIQPYVKPYATYALQIAQLTTAIAQLQDAIQNAASNLTSCSISVPTLTMPIMPPDPSLPEPEPDPNQEPQP